MNDRLDGRRVLVTGATGFLGRRAVARLCAERAIVFATATTPPVREALSAAVSFRAADLLDPSSLGRLVDEARPEIVIHLGAVVNLERSLRLAEACARVNVLGTVHLLQALEGRPIRRFVLASTTEVYGDGPVPYCEHQPLAPPSPYAVSKVAAEQLTLLAWRASGLPAVVLRLATAYGPGQAVPRLIPTLIQGFLRGEPPTVSEPGRARDVVYVDDVVDGLLRGATAVGVAGEVINLGHEHPVTIAELVRTLQGLAGSTVDARYGDVPVRASEARVWASSGDKARRLLGWEPTTPLTTGLARTVAWHRDCVAPVAHEADA